MSAVSDQPEKLPRDIAAFRGKGPVYSLRAIHIVLFLLFVGIIAVVMLYPRRVSLSGGYALLSRPELTLHAATDGVWYPVPGAPGSPVTNGQVLGRIVSERHAREQEHVAAEIRDLASRILSRREDFMRAELPDVRDDNRRALEEVCAKLSEAWRRNGELERLTGQMTLRAPTGGRLAAGDASSRAVHADEPLVRMIPDGGSVMLDVQGPIISAMNWFTSGGVKIGMETDAGDQTLVATPIPGSFSSRAVSDAHTPPEAWGSFKAFAELDDLTFRLPQVGTIVSLVPAPKRSVPVRTSPGQTSGDIASAVNYSRRFSLPAVSRSTGVAEVGSEVAGLLDEVLVKSGSIVTANQAVARIRLERQNILLTINSNNTAVARNEAVAARAFESSYRAQWDAKEALARSNFVSRLELAEFRHRMEQAGALAAASEDRVRLTADEEVLLRWDRALYEIRAPCDGRVGVVYRTRGELMRPNGLLLSIRSQNADLFTLVPQISEALRSGLRFQIEAGGQPLTPDWAGLQHIAGSVWSLPLATPDGMNFIHGETLTIKATLHEDPNAAPAGLDHRPELAELFHLF